MRIVTNTKKIERNRKIGLYTSFGSLIVLILGLVLSFRPNTIGIAYGALLVGLILSQVGIYFGNRWGRTPRIDERLTASLKGLDDRYTLYHFMAPVPHLLTGPAGVWVLVPQHQSGTITYENNRFRQSGVNFLSRFFAQEGLGRPEVEAQSYAEQMQKYIQKSLPENEVPEARPMIVFVNPKVSVQVSESPTPAMHVEKMKDFVRRKAKEQPANMAEIEELEEALPEESI